MSEGLGSYQGHFPVNDRAFECLLSANIRREKTPGPQTEACEIFSTRRWTRANRQEYQTREKQHTVRGCRRKSGTSSVNDDLCLSCDRTRSVSG